MKKILVFIFAFFLCINPVVSVYALTQNNTASGDGFVTIVFGESHNAAITQNRELYMWGNNNFGQLGLGHNNRVNEPEKVTVLSNVVAVSLGVSHSAAITANGDLYTWGHDGSGKLGLGIINLATPFVNIPTKVTALSNVVAVSLGDSHSAAITANGDLYTWGANGSGQLGLGDIFWDSNRAVPNKVTALSNVKTVCLGERYSAAVTANGNLYEWGQIEGHTVTRPQFVRSGVIIDDKQPTDPTYTIASWALFEVNAALIAGLVPDSVANAGWGNATTRLIAADAIVQLIEKAYGKNMSQIAAERGWDLNVNQFADTDSKAVTFLRYAQITNGKDAANNLYAPNDAYTRAEFVTMMGRAAVNIFGLTVQGTHTFTDFIPNWATSYVGYAVENGITQGIGGGHFGSDRILQNQEMVMFCYRAFHVWK
jgi:hypothetical protein